MIDELIIALELDLLNIVHLIPDITDMNDAVIIYNFWFRDFKINFVLCMCDVHEIAAVQLIV